MKVTAHGISAELPVGWETRIFCRDAARAAVEGAVGTPHPVAHMATFPLPAERGDYGSGAVDLMTPVDALIAIVEHDVSSVGTALFAPVGLPRQLRPGQFGPRVLQETIAGQGGCQLFFTEAGRAFSLYIVLGSHAAAESLVPRVNEVLRTIRIEPR